MRISTFEFNLSQPIPPTQQDDVVVSSYTPPIKDNKTKGRKYVSKDRELIGPYMCEQFIKNEYDRYNNKWRIDKEIQYDLLRKYNNNLLKKRFKNHKVTINYLRTLFNRGELYAAQEPTFLLSLRYNDAGIIEPDGRSYRYMYFIECYKRCIEFQIADPRFIEHEYIIEIRNRINSGDEAWQSWRVPDDKWIHTFEERIGKKAYNSVHFPIGWTREESPSVEDFD